MPQFIELTGRRFGRWVVLRRGTPYTSPQGARQVCWLCRCDCGTEKDVFGGALRTGASTSCGCYQRELPHNSFKHGLSKTPEYASWLGARSRATNPDDPGWENYGGRGITMCQRWLDSFEAFLEDMGQKPTPMHTLDRIDNDGPYAPENCRWADKKQQGRNRRSNRLIAYQGQTYPLVELAERLGLTWVTLGSRIDAGWPESEWSKPARPTNVRVDFMGRDVCVSDLAREFGLERRTLMKRIRTGWPPDLWNAPLHTKGLRRRR